MAQDRCRRGCARGRSGSSSGERTESALAAMVPPEVINTNRANLGSLAATNCLAQASATIADTEAEYERMWADDADVMYAYARTSADASALSPFGSPPAATDAAGPAPQDAGVSRPSWALESASDVISCGEQVMAAIPKALQGLLSSPQRSLDDYLSSVTTSLSQMSSLSERPDSAISKLNYLNRAAVLRKTATLMFSSPNQGCVRHNLCRWSRSREVNRDVVGTAALGNRRGDQSRHRGAFAKLGPRANAFGPSHRSALWDEEWRLSASSRRYLRMTLSTNSIAKEEEAMPRRGGMLDFGVLPPEINSGRMYSGPGSGPMLAAATAWDELGAELGTAARGYSSVISELTSAPWVGPSSASMVAAVAPYMSWLGAAGSLAEETADQARAAAAAYDSAFAMTVPPPVITFNRALLMALIATNFFGQNSPAIAATEADYMEMWARTPPPCMATLAPRRQPPT